MNKTKLIIAAVAGAVTWAGVSYVLGDGTWGFAAGAVVSLAIITEGLI